MSDLNLISLLFVENPTHSAEFYGDLLGKAPVEASPTFVMFVLDNGAKFALWAKDTVVPAVTGAGVGGELAFALPDNENIDTLFADWKQRGITMIQEPTEMSFGRTFVVLDPDGHRVRMFAPNQS